MKIFKLNPSLNGLMKEMMPRGRIKPYLRGTPLGTLGTLWEIHYL
jgi:hypothetical protein